MRVIINTHAPRLCFGLAVFLLACCSSREIRISSAPDAAEVTLLKADRTEVSLGKTPILLQEKSNPEVFSDGALLKVAKNDFFPTSVALPKTFIPERSTFHVALKENPMGATCTASIDKFNDLAKGVAQAQTLTKRREYEQAESVLRGMAERFPGVSVVHDLLGNLYYLKRDVARALAEYRRSNEISPNNQQTLRMIEKLSSIRGENVRLPAAEGGN